MSYVVCIQELALGTTVLLKMHADGWLFTAEGCVHSPGVVLCKFDERQPRQGVLVAKTRNDRP